MWQLFFQASDYTSAVSALAKAMQWGVGDDASCPLCGQNYSRKKYPTGACAAIYWYSLRNGYCFTIFRYVHARSALDKDYLRAKVNIESAIAYLHAVSSDECESDVSVSSEMRSKAEMQATELIIFLSSLKKKKDSIMKAEL